VHEGTAVTDWMAQEKERGITITSAATYCCWRNCQINIIDTPGHIDFTVEVERSLKVLDGVVVIFCAVGGVEPQSETVWHQANRYNIPRIAFINKMDRQGADFFAVVKEMDEKLQTTNIPIQIPIYNNDEFVGLVDLIRDKALYYDGEFGEKVVEESIPEAMQSLVGTCKEHLIEKIAELDDQFMQKVLDGEKVSESEIVSVLRAQVIANKIVPVLCGSALKNKGIQQMLGAVCDYLPSPAECAGIDVLDVKNNESYQLNISLNAPLCALCFKVFSDSFAGKLYYTRIYSGKVNSGSSIYNATKQQKERITKILRMHASKQEAVKEAKAGDIICLVGLKSTTTGDTLCDSQKHLILEDIKFPEPVVSLAIEPKTKADQDKLFDVLGKLADEDPSFKVTYNKETGQTIISGMGKLHLEIMVDRLTRDFKVAARIGKPQVAYKETITKRAEVAGKFIQQTGGKGQYGHVVFLMEPLSRGKGLVFESKIKSGAIPKEYIPSVKKGVLEALESGVLGGYPVVNVKVTLVDGSYHDVDSSELAFKVAAEIGIKDGLKKAKSVLLEPIMNLEVVVASEYASQVIGDLNSRRARISAIQERKNLRIIKAEVPLVEVFNYADILRGLTQGRASYIIEPLYYERVPEEVLIKIVGV